MDASFLNITALEHITHSQQQSYTVVSGKRPNTYFIVLEITEGSNDSQQHHNIVTTLHALIGVREYYIHFYVHFVHYVHELLIMPSSARPIYSLGIRLWDHIIQSTTIFTSKTNINRQLRI